MAFEIDDEAEWIGLANDRTDNAKAFFRREYKIDKRRTEIEGHPVTNCIERVKIIVPGDDKAVIDRKVTDEDKTRFADVYAKFRAKMDAGVAGGTPLREWPYLSREWVAKLEFLNFHTVEEIDRADDSVLDRLGPGARDLQKRAKEFLSPASENEQNWRREKLDLEARIQELQSTVRAMQDSGEYEEPKKRGRPRKAA